MFQKTKIKWAGWILNGIVKAIREKKWNIRSRIVAFTIKKKSKEKKAMKKGSWETTALGVLTVLGALAHAGIALLDGNPETVVDFKVLLPTLTAGLGLIRARDNNKSSENVGADR